MAELQQILAGRNELNEKVQNAEARATEAERRAQATQHELASARLRRGTSLIRSKARTTSVENGSSVSQLVWTICWWCAGRKLRTR